nr:MAG TPA: hypothetical protein [Caudoviricetes sp.]
MAQCAQYPRNKIIHDVKRTTPHPPAQFGSKKYFSLNFLQNISRGRAGIGFFA